MLHLSAGNCSFYRSVFFHLQSSRNPKMVYFLRYIHFHVYTEIKALSAHSTSRGTNFFKDYATNKFAKFLNLQIIKKSSFSFSLFKLSYATFTNPKANKFSVALHYNMRYHISINQHKILNFILYIKRKLNSIRNTREFRV